MEYKDLCFSIISLMLTISILEYIALYIKANPYQIQYK